MRLLRYNGCGSRLFFLRIPVRGEQYGVLLDKKGIV